MVENAKIDKPTNTTIRNGCLSQAFKIAIIGAQCSGKTTVANEIIRQCGNNFKIVKFADPIYGTLDCLSEKKNRLFMQEFSDLAKKHFGEAVFVNAFKSKIESIEGQSMLGVCPDIICDDIRYWIEYDMCRQLGFKIVYVRADEYVRQSRAAAQGLVFSPDHSSERFVDDIGKQADVIIVNNIQSMVAINGAVGRLLTLLRTMPNSK